MYPTSSDFGEGRSASKLDYKRCETVRGVPCTCVTQATCDLAGVTHRRACSEALPVIPNSVFAVITRGFGGLKCRRRCRAGDTTSTYRLGHALGSGACVQPRRVAVTHGD